MLKKGAHMLIKKETEYAVIGLTALASKNDRFYDAKMIANEKNISETLLSKVFQKLAVADILESKFGPSGGFRLVRNPKEITLWQIMMAVQIPNVLKCYSGHAPYCQKPSCSFKKLVSKIEKYLEEFLSNTTLNELINNN